MRRITTDELIKAQDEAFRSQHTYNLFPILSRTSVAWSNINRHQLTNREGRQLRILQAGNGATEDDIGKRWFVMGYSRVGGPDIVPLREPEGS